MLPAPKHPITLLKCEGNWTLKNNDAFFWASQKMQKNAEAWWSLKIFFWCICITTSSAMVSEAWICFLGDDENVKQQQNFTGPVMGLYLSVWVCGGCLSVLCAHFHLSQHVSPLRAIHLQKMWPAGGNYVCVCSCVYRFVFCVGVCVVCCACVPVPEGCIQTSPVEQNWQEVLFLHLSFWTQLTSTSWKWPLNLSQFFIPKHTVHSRAHRHHILINASE